MSGKKKRLSIVLIISLFVCMVGVVNLDTSYAASKKIHLKKTTVSLSSGKTFQQKLIDKSGKTISPTKVKWKSAKTSVAKINKKGLVTAVAAGTTKITATYDGEKYSFKVRVAGVRKSSISLLPGSKYQQKLIDKNGKTISPTKVKWKSAKTSVAKISATGRITAVKAGTAKMTAKYRGKTYRFVVKVKKYPVDSFSLSLEEYNQSGGYQKMYLSLYEYSDFVGTRADGYVTIKIVDSSNKEVYKKQIRFRRKDFDVYYSWEAFEGSDTALLIKIPDNTITRGSSATGKITAKVTLDDGRNLGTCYPLSIGNLPVTKDAAEKILHKYIVENGKEVTSSSGLLGDYYIESRSYASSSYNRIAISTYYNDQVIIMYSIANDGSEYVLLHNQPDTEQGIDDFNYDTTEKDDSAYHFPLSYWGKIKTNTYSGKLYGNEQGLYDCKKNGPVDVTNESELYKVYRKSSESMKEFDDFLKSKVGFGLNSLGYSKM